MKKWISTAQCPLLVWSTIRKMVPTTGHDSGEFGVRVVKSSWLAGKNYCVLFDLSQLSGSLEVDVKITHLLQQ